MCLGCGARKNRIRHTLDAAAWMWIWLARLAAGLAPGLVLLLGIEYLLPSGDAAALLMPRLGLLPPELHAQNLTLVERLLSLIVWAGSIWFALAKTTARFISDKVNRAIWAR